MCRWSTRCDYKKNSYEIFEVFRSFPHSGWIISWIREFLVKPSQGQVLVIVWKAACSWRRTLPVGFIDINTVFGFWFLVFGLYAAKQLALQLHQERLQVVRSNKVVCWIPTESNGTPEMNLGCEDAPICRYTNKRVTEQKTHILKTGSI